MKRLGSLWLLGQQQPEPGPLYFRVVLMLRERWHFCRDGRVLLGSRALRERHLGLMGYQLLPVRSPVPPHHMCIKSQATVIFCLLSAAAI